MFGRKWALLVIAFEVVALSACGRTRDKAEETAKAQAITAELQALRSQLEVTQQTLRSAESRLQSLEFNTKWDGTAYLRPGDGGYSRVQGDIGIFTVKLEDIRTYASGSRIKLKIGNLTSATVDGFGATIDWGPEVAYGLPDDAKTHTREVTLSESLEPGKWNFVTLTLEDVPPHEFGFLRVYDVKHRGIRLFR
jgi:hypothetical protein